MFLQKFLRACLNRELFYVHYTWLVLVKKSDVKEMIHRKMEGKILTPNQKEIRVKGKMYYQADDHAWNVLRIKKEVLNSL